MFSIDRSNRELSESFQDSVYNFMNQGGQTIGRFNARQACLYTGLQLEELAEKIDVIKSSTLTAAQRDHLGVLQSTLEMFAKEFKAGMHEGDMLRSQHENLIDADFDLAWVSLGALFSTSVVGMRAIAHGSYTNMEKFRDGVIKDANGKIQKPAGWTPPNFLPYIDTTVRD